MDFVKENIFDTIYENGNWKLFGLENFDFVVRIYKNVSFIFEVVLISLIEKF